MTTPAPDISGLLDQLREQWLEVVKERNELRVERVQLREIARLADALIVNLYAKYLVPYLMESEVNGLRNRIHAVLNDQKGPSE